MLNRDYINSLPNDKKKECYELYRNHPLYDFIDWNAFLNSENGNEMQFVRYKTIIYDEFGNEYYVLKEENDSLLIYSIIDNAFSSISKTGV